MYHTYSISYINAHNYIACHWNAGNWNVKAVQVDQQCLEPSVLRNNLRLRNVHLETRWVSLYPLKQIQIDVPFSFVQVRV